MKKILFSIVAVAALYSCSNSDDNTPINPDEKYLDGVFVSNEGGFNKGNASTSHISGDLNTLTNDIFKTSNGRALGDVAQSMFVTDKYVYIVVNNSNTIEVVNKKTFKSVYTISQNLSSPRYAVVKNNKLYVTSLSDKFVNVYNAETFEYLTKIELNNTAEKIVVANNYIYAANNAYSGGTSVEVIDATNDTNTVDINFESAINSIATNGQAVYVLETSATKGKISVVNNTTVSIAKELEQTNARNITVDGTNIYYTSGTGVYKMANSLDTTSNKIFDVAAGDEYAVLYGFNVINGNIYTADAKDYTDNSKVVIYKENGTILKKFSTGIATNGFYKF